MWVLLAVGSGLLTGLISIITKLKIKTADSNVATAVRMSAAMIFAWVSVLVLGLTDQFGTITPKTLIFLIASGAFTGLTWLFYFKALNMAGMNKVVPVNNSSTFITSILGIIIFQEIHNLPAKIVGIVIIIASVIIMYDRKDTGSSGNKMWFVFALASAFCAAFSSCLSKLGISGINNVLATAIRSIVITIIAWMFVVPKGRIKLFKTTPVKEIVWSAVTGVIYGMSLLCFYGALKNGVISIAMPIDKLCILGESTIVSFIIKEKVTRSTIIGLALMFVGTLVMLIWA